MKLSSVHSVFINPTKRLLDDNCYLQSDV